MINNTEAAPRRPRLNPFVFPSDTTLRFILLIMCVLGANLWIYNSPFLYKTSDFTKYIEAKYQCVKGSRSEKAFQEIAAHNPRGPADLEAAQNASQQCLAPFELQEAMRMLVGLILLLSVAGFIYLVLPAWKRWRKRLVPLPVELMPDVAAELANLCREAGLARQPAFFWNPLSSVSEGLAFGCLGQYVVALTGGLIKQFYTDRPAFRAVIRHELAHLRNADVDKTYFSVAIWWAFVITTLLPGAIYLNLDFADSVLNVANLPFFLNLIGRVLALAILVLLTRNAVLRSRELYADVRASTWDGPTGALSRVLNHFTHPKRGLPWTMLLAHPVPEIRYTVVNDTRPLFQSNFWTAFGTGIAAAIAFNGVYNLSSVLGDLLQFTSLTAVIAGLLFGGLTIGVVGSLLWRATFATLVEGKTPQRTGWTALGVVLGITVGLVLSLSSFTSTWPPLNVLGGFLVGWTLWGLTLLGSLWPVLRWIVVAATTWLPVTANTSILRWSSRSSLIVAGGIWAVFFGSLLLVSDFFSLDPGDAVSVFAALLAGLLFLAQSFTTVGLIGLWAIPLAASFWRRRGTTIEGANWAFLDTPYTSPQHMTLSSENPFRLRFALVLGLVGGLILLWSYPHYQNMAAFEPASRGQR